MSAKLMRLLAMIKSRTGQKKGIALATEFISTIRTASGVGFSKHFAGISEDKILGMLKDAESTLVHRDEQQIVVGGVTPGETGVSQFGEFESKDTKPTEKSVMDFECILTSKRKDRDGDVLYPDGADLDMKMPLLWQHIPMEPIGKLVGLVKQTSDFVKVRFAIADTPLGRDAAVLVDFGALRISHGFQPIKFEPMDAKEGKEGEFNGWDVFKYHVMEGSLVSIPSNTDAIITASSREKLHSPLMKEWAKAISDARAPMVKSGFDGNITVNVNLGGEVKPTKSAEVTPVVKTPVAAPVAKKEAPKPVVKPVVKATPKAGDANGGLDDDDTDETDANEKDEETDNEGDDMEDKDAEESAPVLLSEIIDTVSAVQSAAGLPTEAADRLTVVIGILNSLTDSLTTCTDAISAAADGQDLAGVISGVQDLVETAISKLNTCGDDLSKIAEMADMPSDAASGIADALAKIGQVNDALSAMAGVASSVANDDPASGGSGGDPVDPSNQPLDSEENQASADAAAKLLGLLLCGRRVPLELLKSLREELPGHIQRESAALAG